MVPKISGVNYERRGRRTCGTAGNTGTIDEGGRTVQTYGGAAAGDSLLEIERVSTVILHFPDSSAIMRISIEREEEGGHGKKTGVVGQ